MSDWRTSQAPYQQRSRLPEDDLPEIDWGAAAFTPGGGDEPEPEPMPDPGEEERAMARLRARIAERDAAEGLIDPWAQAQAAPMGPQSPPLPGSPAPLRAPRGGRTDIGLPQLGAIEMGPAAPPAAPMTPQQSAHAAFRQPALDAVRAGVGAVTPPPDPMAPPPEPTAPDAVPTATTDPNAPTVTAGSQAAGLAQRPAAPQSPTMAPTGAPQFAMGATGLGGAQSGMSDRVAAGAPDGNVFERQLDAARNEDVRRERIRKIILGLGAMLAGGTGNMGLMLPAAIGAGLVRRPDEEATLRANDERAQAVGGAQAEQRALLEQLAMRREAQQATERNQRETLALRMREMEGSEADRARRTDIEVAQEEREAGLVDPASRLSEQRREALVRFARTLPPEVQESVLGGDISGLSAEDAERLIISLGGVESGRQRGGGAPGGGGGLAPGQRLVGVNVAPEAFVLSVQQASPSMSAADAQQAADIQWAAMPERMRSHWSSSAEGSRMATALGQRVPGYEREGLEALAPEQFREARETAIQIAQLEESVSTAIEAVDEIASLGTGDELAARGGDVFGAELHPAVSAYNNARADIMGTLADMRRTGVINESEYHRFIRDMPDVSNPRQALSGSRRLQAVLASARQAASIRMRGLGYRRGESGVTASGQPTTTADAPPAPEREHPIVFRVRLPDGRVQQIRTTPSRAEADQARARERGWTVVQ